MHPPFLPVGFSMMRNNYLSLENRACGRPQEALVCVVRQLIIHPPSSLKPAFSKSKQEKLSGLTCGILVFVRLLGPEKTPVPS